ncbi:hypothetical protein [Granulicella sp. S190]|uniref:hypothetical protein n=1 Tax=Granulicella sp. S190 TaxID=1747226 RepID=UPI00131E5807|nr:hypothetical protein [Granulicella sp. S190]
MRSTLKNLVLAFAALTTATSFAENVRAYVPFSFNVKAQVFPAGYYDVTLDPPHSFISLVSEKDSTKFFTMATGSAEKRTAETVLHFTVTGTDHCLNTIQMGQRLTLNVACRTPSRDIITVQGH